MPPKKKTKGKAKGKGKTKISRVTQVQTTRVSVRVAGGEGGRGGGGGGGAGGGGGYSTPMGYATYAPQMPYMPSQFIHDTGMPAAPIKQGPMNLMSTGVSHIPTRPSSAQAHSEMSVGERQAFLSFMDEPTPKQGVPTPVATASSQVPVPQTRPSQQTTMEMEPWDPADDEINFGGVKRPRHQGPAHYNNDQPDPLQRIFMQQPAPPMQRAPARERRRPRSNVINIEEVIDPQIEGPRARLPLPVPPAGPVAPAAAAAPQAGPVALASAAGPRRVIGQVVGIEEVFDPQIEGPAQIVVPGHHRDNVPQLHDALVARGRHGRQQDRQARRPPLPYARPTAIRAPADARRGPLQIQAPPQEMRPLPDIKNFLRGQPALDPVVGLAQVRAFAASEKPVAVWAPENRGKKYGVYGSELEPTGALVIPKKGGYGGASGSGSGNGRRQGYSVGHHEKGKGLMEALD